MKAWRRFFGLRKIVSSSIFLDCRSHRICSYSTLDSWPNRRWSYFSEAKEEESSVFKHTLMSQRPSTIDYIEKLCNSVNLIGTVERPLKKVNCTGDSFGVYTILKFRTSSHSRHYSEVMLQMWNKMAEMSIVHLKPNDFIYVWGDLHCYEMIANEGKRKIFHKVRVKEINYVSQDGKGSVHKQTNTMNFQGKDYQERNRERLLLWQTFFVNPYEWNDYRKNKHNPRAPDFKHKSTGEALWINPDDPPWIRRQLKFIDSITRGQSQEGYTHADLCSFLSENQSS